MTWRKPPETTPQWKPSRRSVRMVVRAPGVSSISPPTSSMTDASRPASVATRWCSDWAKSISPRIAASVTARTLSSTPGVGGEHLDDLALDQRRVDVEDDQPLRAPGQTGAFDGDVHADPAATPPGPCAACVGIRIGVAAR